jgi:hypothetical protein
MRLESTILRRSKRFATGGCRPKKVCFPNVAAVNSRHACTHDRRDTLQHMLCLTFRRRTKLILPFHRSKRHPSEILASDPRQHLALLPGFHSVLKLRADSHH